MYDVFGSVWRFLVVKTRTGASASLFPARAAGSLIYRQMLFSEYAVRFCTVTLLFTASNCISVGGPFCIKKVVEATCTPSSTNTSRVDRSTKT